MRHISETTSIQFYLNAESRSSPVGVVGIRNSSGVLTIGVVWQLNCIPPSFRSVDFSQGENIDGDKSMSPHFSVGVIVGEEGESVWLAQLKLLSPGLKMSR